jgi:DNA-binding MarR family transcriptional regulator
VDDGRRDVTELTRELFRQATALATGLSAESGLHLTDLRALQLLFATCGEPITLGLLGRRLGLSSPAVTALVDRLEQIGMAARMRDLPDRRQVRVHLTDEARHFLDRHMRAMHERIAVAVSLLNDDDLAPVRGYLTALTRSPGPSGGPVGSPAGPAAAHPPTGRGRTATKG